MACIRVLLVAVLAFTSVALKFEKPLEKKTKVIAPNKPNAHQLAAKELGKYSKIAENTAEIWDDVKATMKVSPGTYPELIDKLIASQALSIAAVNALKTRTEAAAKLSVDDKGAAVKSYGKKEKIHLAFSPKNGDTDFKTAAVTLRTLMNT